MRQELSAKLNKYLANISIVYVKLHNLHWNVTGRQFKAVHEYLETLYDGFADVMDATAEIIRINGEAPLASMREYIKAADIEELESREIDVEHALNVALADMKVLKAQAEDIRAEAGKADEYGIVNQMESDLENYHKTIWFLSSMLK